MYLSSLLGDVGVIGGLSFADMGRETGVCVCVFVVGKCVLVCVNTYLEAGERKPIKVTCCFFVQTETVFWKWSLFRAMTVAVHGPL